MKIVNPLLEDGRRSVLEIARQKYWYDDNGNQTTRVYGPDTYKQIYDAENRLVEVKKNDITMAQFVYNGDGQRVKSVVNGETIQFVNGYYEKKGAEITKYYYAGASQVAVRKYTVPDGRAPVREDREGEGDVRVWGEVNLYPNGWALFPSFLYNSRHRAGGRLFYSKENVMNKRTLPIFLALFALVFASMACAFGGELGLTNLRMAFDEDGKQVTTSFSPNDAVYAVADLANAKAGDAVSTKWYAVSVEGEDPNTFIDESVINIDQETFTGTVHFFFDAGQDWPAGTYAVEFYLNGTLVNTVTYTVQ